MKERRRASLTEIAEELEDADDLTARLDALTRRVADEVMVPGDLESILLIVSRLSPKDELTAARASWVRGVIVGRFGSDRQAVQLMEKVCLAFARREMLDEMVLVSLDLAYSHWRLGNVEAVGRSVTHAVMLFRHRYSTTTLAALVLLRDLVLHDEVDDQAIESVRRAVATGDLSWLERIERTPSDHEPVSVDTALAGD